METQMNDQLSHAAANLRAAFVEESSRFRQNAETAHRMRADIAGLREQFKTECNAAYEGLGARRILQEAFNKHLAALCQPSIIIAGRRTPDPFCPEPSVSHLISPDDLFLFLSALNDLQAKYWLIDELQIALQGQDLEQLERWVRHGKCGLPPESN